MNIIGKISHFFTKNTSLSIMLFIAVLLFGMIAFFITPKQYNPEITRPAFAVTTVYEGATTKQTIDRVVYELVEKVRIVPGVDEVMTTVRDGGVVNTTVIFEVGYDSVQAKLDLWSELEQHSYRIEGFITSPQIVEINPETIPVMQIAFGGDGYVDPASLRKTVVELSHELNDIDGVSELSVHGGYRNSLIIEIEPERLAEYGVGVDAVMTVVASAQTRSVYTDMSSDLFAIELVSEGNLDTVEKIGTLPINDTVRVRDVARVYEGVSGTRSYVRYDSKTTTGDVVVLAVGKVEGSSAPKVTKSITQKIDSLLVTSKYEHLTYKVVGDDGRTASTEIYGLTKNLITSIIIVAAVLVLFLSVRAAAVVLVAIPMTLLIVFGLGFLFGETINRITLFALILSLGLLVDSAIVVVENIYEHLAKWHKGDKKESRVSVIAYAVHEIGIGLLLSTVTSVIVFMPMAYITGMMGPYMGPIAFFVPVALVVSLVVAVIVTPFIASIFLIKQDVKLPIQRWFGNKLTKLTTWYGLVLQNILANRVMQRKILRGALGLFLITLILPITGLVHFQMLPKADRDQVYVYIDAPVDASIERTKNIAQNVTSLILEEELVTSVQSYIGEAPIVDFNGMFKGAHGRQQPSQATLRVNLVATANRSESSVDITKKLREQVSSRLPNISSYVRLMEEPPGPPVRATFVAKVMSEQTAVQTATVDSLFSAIKPIPGIVDTYQTIDAPVTRVVYVYNHEAASQLGVSYATVENTLQLLSGSVTVAEYRYSDQVELTPIELTLAAKQRSTPTDISNLTVVSSNGLNVPLSAVLQPTVVERPSAVYLEDGSQLSYVTAEVSDRSIVYIMIDVMRTLARGEVEGLSMDKWGLFGMTLVDEESGSKVEIEWGGEWEMTLENFRDLGIAMGVALVLVYGVLVAQYGRFSTPAYILITVPLGLVGILWGFFVLDSVFGIYLTATALIGFIALIGLVVNNAIIFLEYVEQLIAEGEGYKEALVGAGQARLRPILLTSLTTVLGSLTIASDPVWSGLAWAIVFGLSFSTVLTLVIYPTLLMYFTGHTYNK